MSCVLRFGETKMAIRSVSKDQKQLEIFVQICPRERRENELFCYNCKCGLKLPLWRNLLVLAQCHTLTWRSRLTSVCQAGVQLWAPLSSLFHSAKGK